MSDQIGSNGAYDEQEIHPIEAHIEKYIGPIDSVFHEIVSDMIHLDVYMVKPTPERNFYTLITGGMSQLPMKVPEDLAHELKFAELLIALPPDWEISDQAFQKEENYWPVGWLKKLARLPHHYETWLGIGHTIPNGDPVEPFADNTDLCCFIIASPILCDEAFGTLEDPQKTIQFYSILPIYQDEMEYKLRNGSEALFALMGEANLSELLDIERPSVL